MRVLRTPDERFEGLADWPYKPHYVEISDDLRVQISPSGRSVTCRYCSRCGAIIPLTLKEAHDDFHHQIAPPEAAP